MGKQKGTIDPSIYRAILASMGEGIVFLDPDDCFTYINAAAEKLRGIRAEDYLGKHILSIFATHSPHQTQERVQKLLAALKSGAVPFHKHVIQVRGRIFENSYYPIRSSRGDYVGTLMVSRDITEKERLKEENLALREQVLSEFGCCDIVGKSDAMRPVFQVINASAAVDSTILITGESGTGKELVARAIHQHSQRKDHPMIKVNCAALPDTLLESELFGHEKGAFTGALSQKKGKFDLADGGTLFLDEIGDMSLKTQAKVLRLIQERCFERVGGTRLVSVDVRIIAATNKDLDEEIRQGQFREDLYYRLNVIQFRVPALRDRPEDIPLLVQHFVNVFYKKEGREPKLFLPEALELLKQHHWPGNVRELRNIVERILIMAPGRTVTCDDIPELQEGYGESRASFPTLQGALALSTLREAREEFEREFIAQKLGENDWNISRTAEIIELERSNLHRKIKSYGIDVRK
jgi:PAS domain S-box-containing protein